MTKRHFQRLEAGTLNGMRFGDVEEHATTEDCMALAKRLEEALDTMDREQRIAAAMVSYCASWATQRLFQTYFEENSMLRDVMHSVPVEEAAQMIDHCIMAGFRDGMLRLATAMKNGLTSEHDLATSPGFVIDFGPIVGPLYDRAARQGAVDGEGQTRQ